MADDLEPGPDPVPVGWWREAAEAERAKAGEHFAQRKAEPMLTAGTDVAGKLYRGEHEGEVQGWLYDHRTRLRIEFRGSRDPRPQKRGYLITGKVMRS